VLRQALLRPCVLGRHFVLGQTIEQAIRRAARPKAGYRYSYDMLGEAAARLPTPSVSCRLPGRDRGDRRG
jgi:hypothetical protein